MARLLYSYYYYIILLDSRMSRVRCDSSCDMVTARRFCNTNITYQAKVTDSDNNRTDFENVTDR